MWTCQVTRVLVLPRTAYDELVKAYPNQARQVMTAVKAHVEQVGTKGQGRLEETKGRHGTC